MVWGSFGFRIGPCLPQPESWRERPFLATQVTMGKRGRLDRGVNIPNSNPYGPLVRFENVIQRHQMLQWQMFWFIRCNFCFVFIWSDNQCYCSIQEAGLREIGSPNENHPTLPSHPPNMPNWPISSKQSKYTGYVWLMWLMTYVTYVTYLTYDEQAILAGTDFPSAFIFYTLAHIPPPGTISFRTPFFAPKTWSKKVQTPLSLTQHTQDWPETAILCLREFFWASLYVALFFFFYVLPGQHGFWFEIHPIMPRLGGAFHFFGV